MAGRATGGEAAGGAAAAGGGAPALGTEPGGQRKASLTSAVLANLRGLTGKVSAAGATASGSRRPSRASIAAAGSGSAGSRRGSVALALGAAATASGPAEEAGEQDASKAAAVHPGLNRIKSFTRKRSVFRNGRAAESFDELAAAMDALDARIGGTLQQMRAQNSSGLGLVHGLSHSRSGRLRFSKSAAAAAAASGSVPATAVEGAAASESAATDTYSPRELLGAEAAERPNRFLPRIKFEVNEHQDTLHLGGFSTARGRLEGNAADAGPGSSSGEGAQAGTDLIPAVHGSSGSGAAMAKEQQQPAARQQRHSVAVLPSQLQGARWGATEGGLDRLGWVRELVKFSDFKQQQLQVQQQPAVGAASGQQGPQASMDTIGWLESGAGLRPQTAASSGTGAPGTAGPQLPGTAGGAKAAVRSREEVGLLQAWLQDMMVQLIAQAGQQKGQDQAGGSAAEDPGGSAGPGNGGVQGSSSPGAPVAGAAAGAAAGSAGSAADQSAADMADAALWVYGMAFEELQRQVGTECGDRGMLLGAMWQHVFNLVELRCSLAYEAIIGAVREELQAARRQQAALAAQARAAELRVQESMYYSKDKYAAMEAEVKRTAQLLATAEEEAARQADELALLRRAVDTQSSLRVTAEGRLAEEQRQRMELEHQREQLQATSSVQASEIASQEAELVQLRADLQHARAEGLALAEDKARLEVDVKKTQRDFQAAEIMALSLREQLAAREAELAQLSTRHAQLQQEQLATSSQLMESQASLTDLQVRHDNLQASSAERAQRLEQSLEAEQAALADTQRQLAAAQATGQDLEKRLQETAAREVAVTSQLKQLAGAHEQQTSKLRQETDARRNGDDELQALRAGLQVTQQRLEGLGLVFASNTAHRTSAEAWRATGPISMARQVVTAVNQQLGELSSRKAELQHELGAAKERWQAEEAVRIRLQEQLLEAKAANSKLVKEREGLDGVVSRLEAQHVTLDAELAQMRKMLTETEARCQASHKKGMEVANEAKRLAPLEPKVARLEEAVHAAHAELERVQREVTTHQATIRKLLEEKSTALEQLAARSQALDAAQLQIRELTAASKDRLQLAEDKEKLEEQLHQLHQRCSATERLQGESMHQLTVARRLLADTQNADERAKLQQAEQELQRSKVTASAQRRESLLLKDRLAAVEGQLQFMEKQLQVAVHSPLAAAVAAVAVPASTGAAAGGGAVGVVSPAVVEQLKRLLETKEERIRQLERLQSSLAASTSQLKQLQQELGARDAEIIQLRTEVEATRRRLHSLQALALDYARNHLRSELAWTKAKLVVVCHMASGLRAKLQQEKDARTQAELESVCVEAFYLEKGLMDQRAFAAAFDATFMQVKSVLTSVLQALVELRRQLVAPATANLPCIAEQFTTAAAALSIWLERFSCRTDQSCQADPLIELEAWQQAILGGLPAARPTSPPPLQHVSAIIVQVYAHRLRQLPALGPSEQGALADNVYEAMAEFFCERRGFSREAALSPTGPVAALLAGARSHLQQPKQLLLGRLAGMVPSGGSGSSRSLQHPAAWQFFVRLLCCLRALLGAGWDPVVKEWIESEDGVPLQLQCVMDVLANLYNTDAPALLDSMRQGLVPLVRQGRRGPAVDLDAFLLVVMNEYCDGACPISPLALPRRLTDGCVASTLSPGTAATSLGNTVSGVAVVVGAADAYPGVAAPIQDSKQQARSPMRRRIVNLTVGADAMLAPAVPHRSAAASPEPVIGQQQQQASAGSPPAAPAGVGSLSSQVLSGMHSMMANPALPVGLRSQLRASAPSNPPAVADR